jgi:transcriptional regulator with XRE-family HTH domain
VEPWRRNLKRLIDERGVEAFMDSLGVKAPTVSRWRNGKRWPDPGMLIRICDAFELTPDELFGHGAGAPDHHARPRRLDVPSRPEVVELALRLREAQEVVEPYLNDDDRKSLEVALARTRNALASRRKGRTRQAGRGSKP